MNGKKQVCNTYRTLTRPAVRHIDKKNQKGSPTAKWKAKSRRNNGWMTG
jgi:hypothetical protein